MKHIVIAVGQNIEAKSFGSLIQKIEKYLDSGKYDFEGFIAVTENEPVPLRNRELLSNFIDYAESSLGMFFNVFFTRKNIPVSTLEIVKNCERFFFLEGAEVTQSESDPLNGCSMLSQKVFGTESVESVNALKFRGFDEFSFQDVRQVYFGLDKTEMVDSIGGGNEFQTEFEVFGDISSFKINGMTAINERVIDQKKTKNAA